MHKGYKEERPWGTFEILELFSPHGGECHSICVKKIVIHPGQRLSYQRHAKRNEHWYFVSGNGIVVHNEVEIPVTFGSALHIQSQDKHRAINTSTDSMLVFIETMTGEYDEEDIERFHDDYGRV